MTKAQRQKLIAALETELAAVETTIELLHDIAASGNSAELNSVFDAATLRRREIDVQIETLAGWRSPHVDSESRKLVSANVD